MPFHIFHINEIYSNADGSVQFIEFMGDADGQHIWAGHFITSTDGVSTNTFPINTNLPNAATNNRAVLVATQGFADLNIVTPDYIIPNGFLFTTNGTVNFPGMDSINYIQLPTDGILSLNGDGVTTGTNSPANFAGQTGSIPSNVISGTDGADSLTGTTGNDIIQAGSGNDTINGAQGNDTVNGGPGADTAIYSSNRADYSILATVSGLSVSGPEGTDALSNMERLQFSDKKLAVDLAAGQAAHNTVRLIGAAFDAPAIEAHPEYVGIGLNLFDSGQSMLEVSELAITAMGNPGDDAFVDTVFQNVVGVAPTADEHDFFTGLLENSGGPYTQAQLLELAANSDLNATNIDLIGLQQSGVVFV